MFGDIFRYTTETAISCSPQTMNGKPERNWNIMRNLRLDICYDGTRYRGWQRLPGVQNTIQGKIEATLTRILGEPIEITASGRTDAGVHAEEQTANFKCETLMDEVEEGYVVSQTPEYRNDMCHHCTPLDIIYHLLWSLGYSIVMHHSALRMPIP